MRVRFAGRDLDGFVVERRAHAEHPGRLAASAAWSAPSRCSPPRCWPSAGPSPTATPASSVTCCGSPCPSATPPQNAPSHKAGPPRRRSVTGARTGTVGRLPRRCGAAAPGRVRGGPGRRVARPARSARPTTTGRPPWPSPPRPPSAAGRGSPRRRARPPRRRPASTRALTQLLGPGQHVRLTADQGPQARYTAWLKVLRGHVRCVVGTRAAAFAPAARPRSRRLVGRRRRPARRAPGARTRTSATSSRLRAAADAALRCSTGGFGRSVPRPAAASRTAPSSRCSRRRRRSGPPRRGCSSPATTSTRSVTGRPRSPTCHRSPGAPPRPRSTTARSSCRCPAAATCPSLAVPALPRTRALRALPRAHGYAGRRLGADLPVVRCDLRTAGLRLPAVRRPRLRSTVVGARRTAEELGRAFPGVPVRTSGSGEVLAAVGARTGARHRHPRRRTGRRGRLRGRRSSSTAGPCSTGPASTPPSRRCAAGWARRR